MGIFDGSYTTRQVPGKGTIRYYDDGRTESYDLQGRLLGSQGGVKKQKGSFASNVASLLPGGKKADFGAVAGNIRDAAYDLSGADTYMSAMRSAQNEARRTGNLIPSFTNLARGALGLGEGALNIALPLKGARAGFTAARAAGSTIPKAFGRTAIGATAPQAGKTAFRTLLGSPIGGTALAGVLQGILKLVPEDEDTSTPNTGYTGANRGRTTGRVGEYETSPYGASKTSGPAAATTGSGTTGGSGAGTGGAATDENIGTVLGALPPEVQAELDRQRIAEQAAYDDALNRIAQERTTGSVGAQEAIREARRAGTGGFIDVAAEAAEGGLGTSPGIVGVAQDVLRAQEAANVASARKRFMQIASQLGMTAEQAQRALDRALANIRQGELTARAQAGMNYIPQMGGI